MVWLPRGLRWAAVASAALLITATTTADASRGRLKAIDPYWIAHGRQIAFTGWYSHKSARAKQWIMNADGSHRRSLASPAWNWSLSPSGRGDASVFDYGHYGVVWVYWPTKRIRGKTHYRITKFTIRVPAVYGFPDWSPDEGAVAIEVDTDTGPNRAMLFVAELRGGLHLISQIGSRDDMNADWSPDSRRIAFVSCLRRYYRPCNLVLIRRDGGGRKVVVRNVVPSKPEFASGLVLQPVWAPSGRTISYAVGFGDHREKKWKDCPKCIPVDLQRRAIYVVRPDGSGPRRIGATSYMDTVPDLTLTWSPDSRRIAFAVRRGVTIVDVNDGSRTADPAEGVAAGVVAGRPANRLCRPERCHDPRDQGRQAASSYDTATRP